MTKIAIYGTGNLAATLGAVWARAGHDVAIGGRSRERADEVAEAIGGRSVSLPELTDSDVIVLAISPGGVEDALRLAGAADGSWTDHVVLDATNPVDFTTGNLLYDDGSMAERVAKWTSGARVVKALHLYAGQMWIDRTTDDMLVVTCGDDEEAIDLVGELVSDLGGTSVAIGDLSAARQMEDAAGFVMRIAGAGLNPRHAVPNVS